MSARPRKQPIIAREGWGLVALFAGVSAALSGLTLWLLDGGAGAYAVVGCGAALTIWCVWFFRDPERRTPGGPGLIVSPADGVVTLIDRADPPAELGLGGAAAGGAEPQRMTRIGIFMNVFNVHVNRAPLAGTVVKKHYRPGKFFNAAFDKASSENERMSLVIDTPGGLRLVVVQIAGLIARRIVCKVGEGASLRAGERFGLIKFGSRVDVYLPAGAEPVVKKGDRSVGGETVLATINVDSSPETQRFEHQEAR